MKCFKLNAISTAILFFTLFSNANSETVIDSGTVGEEADSLESGTGPYTKESSEGIVTPESLRKQLRTINIQRPKVSDSESLGAIPQLPDEVPSGEGEGMWRLRRDAMHFFSGGMQFRNRNGEEGFDQLFEAKAPLQFNFNTGYGRVDLDTSTEFLTSGQLSDDQFTNRYYGTLALVPAAQRPNDISDDNAGEAISIGYEVGGFELRVGTTPLGFEISNATVIIRFDHSFSGGFNFGLGASSVPVKDSILSYSGLKDPITGEKWGAVMKNAGNLSLGFDAGNFGVYIDGTVAVYTGDQVEDNDFFQVNTGLYFYPHFSDTLQISSGFNVTYFEFEENLRFFTFGQGGYFSPQSFLSTSIPLRIAYTEGKVTVKVDMGVGVQYFTEDSAAFYPSDPNLQAELEAIEALQPIETRQPVTFDDDSDTQFAVRGSTEIIYQLSTHLSANSLLGFSNAASYKEVIFLVGMEYRFGKGY